ncbi:MAG: Stp1/IreP family PP2C-type Ser/Thr phosphatase, partial [Bdellovibrionales bacterium]|nr:Stp1/IreP family PP2C-type Ser/Thr phosphatase [Bdellovibrionales bacterium]
MASVERVRVNEPCHRSSASTMSCGAGHAQRVVRPFREQEASVDSPVEHGQVSSKVAYRFAVRTDVGQRRTENQDSFGYVRTANGALFIVADGMGGAQGGATASAAAVELIAKRALTEQGIVTEASLRAAIEAANSSLHAFSGTDESLAGMGTTVVALALFSDRALIAHVGDSRIYRLREGKIDRLTRDHTLIQEMLDAGTISPAQAENHPISHMLTRSLGPTPRVDVDVRVFPDSLRPGDRFLLCCDGLVNHVADEDLVDILACENSLDAAADQCIALANERGGSDNITVQIVEIAPSGELVADEPQGDDIEFVTSSEEEFTNTAGDLFALSGLETSASSGEEEDDELGDPAGLDTGRSAVDSLLFGDNPSEDDILQHESRVKKKKSGGLEVEDDEDEEEEEFVEEFEDEDEEEDELTQDELRQLSRVQMLAAIVVVVAILVTVFVVLPSASDKSTIDTGTIAENSAHEAEIVGGGFPVVDSPEYVASSGEMPSPDLAQ